MKTPKDLKNRILTNPWFLWLLVLLGVNPVALIGHAPEIARDVVQSTARVAQDY